MTPAPRKPALRPENRWEIPAAWQANIRGERVAVWRVFADLEPVRRILGGISNP